MVNTRYSYIYLLSRMHSQDVRSYLVHTKFTKNARLRWSEVACECDACWILINFIEHTICKFRFLNLFVLYIVERVVLYVGKVLHINWKEDLILERNHHEEKNKLCLWLCVYRHTRTVYMTGLFSNHSFCVQSFKRVLKAVKVTII
jgi:hypothetical protein